MDSSRFKQSLREVTSSLMGLWLAMVRLAFRRVLRTQHIKPQAPNEAF